MAEIDWQAWYNETLDALVATLEDAQVDWAEDPEGNPWIIVGDRESTGIEYPACFIVGFSKNRDDQESSRSDEWHTIQATLLVLQKGDVKEPQANLREALNLITRVENAIYDNRHLSRTCERASVTDTTPFAGVGQDENLEGGEIQLEIRKQAQIYA